MTRQVAGAAVGAEISTVKRPHPFSAETLDSRSSTPRADIDIAYTHPRTPAPTHHCDLAWQGRVCPVRLRALVFDLEPALQQHVAVHTIISRHTRKHAHTQATRPHTPSYAPTHTHTATHTFATLPARAGSVQFALAHWSSTWTPACAAATSHRTAPAEAETYVSTPTHRSISSYTPS